MPFLLLILLKKAIGILALKSFYWSPRDQFARIYDWENIAEPEKKTVFLSNPLQKKVVKEKLVFKKERGDDVLVYIVHGGGGRRRKVCYAAVPYGALRVFIWNRRGSATYNSVNTRACAAAVAAKEKKKEQEESQQSLPTIVTNDEDGMPDESKERGGRAALIRPGGAILIRLISI